MRGAAAARPRSCANTAESPFYRTVRRGSGLCLASPPSALGEPPAAREALPLDLADTEEAEREHDARPGDAERRPAITAGADGGNSRRAPRWPGQARPPAARVH